MGFIGFIGFTGLVRFTGFRVEGLRLGFSVLGFRVLACLHSGAGFIDVYAQLEFVGVGVYGPGLLLTGRM